MFILIRKNYGSVKSTIKNLIDKGEINNWSFVNEEDRLRLVYTGDNCEYNDVVLRFLSTFNDGEEYLKIRPTVKLDAPNREQAENHFGVVLGRFSELLNSFFKEIGSYEFYF